MTLANIVISCLVTILIAISFIAIERIVNRYINRKKNKDIDGNQGFFGGK
jgi:hypothetical protein